MKITKIETTAGEIYTLYDVSEISENKEWYSIRTTNGYKRNIKKENVSKIKTFNED